jgi:hypothetical protein
MELVKNRRPDWTVLAFEAGRPIGQAGQIRRGIQCTRLDSTYPRSDRAAQLHGLDQGVKELDWTVAVLFDMMKLRNYAPKALEGHK